MGLIIAPWEATGPAALPSSFTWGVTTAAEQVESPSDPPPRPESAWDRLRGTGGRAGFLTTFREDVELARELGVTAFRLSLSWSRLLPDGRGRPRREAMDAYTRVLEAITGAGLEPIVALAHREAPRWFAERGGWASLDAAARLADIAEHAALAWGTSCSFVTLEDPGGEVLGPQPPGARAPDPVAAFAQLARAHELACLALRGAGPAGMRVGISLPAWSATPGSGEPGDRSAARLFEELGTGRWLDVARGVPRDDEMPDPRAPLDAARAVAAIAGSPGAKCDLVILRPSQADVRTSRDMPCGITWRDALAPPEHAATLSLVESARRLAPSRPRMIASSVAGAHAGDEDLRGPSAERAEERRADALRAGLAATRSAMAAGAPFTGWFAGSLLDGFEWESAGRLRTGIYRVEDDGHRLATPSSRALQDMVAEQR